VRRPKLYIASREDITGGRITDIYFVRTKKILEAKGLKNLRVRMEVHVSDLPRGYDWAVFARPNPSNGDTGIYRYHQAPLEGKRYVKLLSL